MKKFMESMGMNTKGPKKDAPKAKPTPTSAPAKSAPTAPKIAEVTNDPKAFKKVQI